jgi:hypothetical protein
MRDLSGRTGFYGLGFLKTFVQPSAPTKTIDIKRLIPQRLTAIPKEGSVVPVKLDGCYKM